MDRRPVEVTGRLAAALQSSHPRAGDLIMAALQHRKSSVREDAQRQVLVAFDADPEIEDVFLHTLLPIEPATFAKIMRGWRGDHGEGLMARLASQARSPELRARAAAVLEELRAPAGAEVATGQGSG